MNHTHYLLVDGYNIIHSWDELKALTEDSLDDARERLIARLANYQGYVQTGIIVVFDAYKVKGGVENVTAVSGLAVVYTKEAETADAYIERTAHSLTKRYSVSVATSDKLEQIIILSSGARRLSAEALLRDVLEAEQIIRQQTDKLRPVKKNQLSDNLDPRTAAMLEEMRKGT
jgi:predicted RNA-binding protein with PIN domain